MSILGLWQWDHSIFDLMRYPSYQEGETVHEFTNDDKQLLIDNLMSECAELEILYPNPVVMKNMIGLWSGKELGTWNRVYRAALTDYNPIENYHRTEQATQTLNHFEQHSGNDVNAATGTDTETGKLAAYDTGTLADHDQTSMLHGRTDTFTHGEKLQHGGTIGNNVEAYGNIGVTTSQQMLESDLVLAPKLNVFNYIIESFKNRFCILVY